MKREAKRLFVLANLSQVKKVAQIFGCRTFYKFHINGVDVTSQIWTLKRRKLVRTFPCLRITAAGKYHLEDSIYGAL